LRPPLARRADGVRHPRAALPERPRPAGRAVIALRVKDNISRHNTSLIAAGTPRD
jgi:hypothetical protein